MKYGFGEGFAGDPHHVAYYLFGLVSRNSAGAFSMRKGPRCSIHRPASRLKDWKAFYDSGVFVPSPLA